MSVDSDPGDLVRHTSGWKSYTNEEVRDQIRVNTADGIIFKSQLTTLGAIIAALAGVSVPAYLLY